MVWMWGRNDKRMPIAETEPWIRPDRRVIELLQVSGVGCQDAHQIICDQRKMKPPSTRNLFFDDIDEHEVRMVG